MEIQVTKDRKPVGVAELPDLRSDFTPDTLRDLQDVFGRGVAVGIASVLMHLYQGTSVDLGYGIKVEPKPAFRKPPTSPCYCDSAYHPYGH